ncbi:hypothetical protein ABW19_dt0200463 [Dactylella cylindrospora]|nr:hypothetical protein ABW19_dt0200463 [Dactylella cylindrospora]
MESTSTNPTTPLVSGAGNGMKSDENLNPKPPSPQAVSDEISAQQQADPAAKAPIAGRTAGSLNKPKAEHLQYFLNSLPSTRGDDDMKADGDKISRPDSSGRVPAGVQALGDIDKRGSNQPEGDRVRKGQEVHRPFDQNNSDNVVSGSSGKNEGRFLQPPDTLPTEFEHPYDASSTLAVMGSNAGDTLSNSNDGQSKGASIRFSFLKKRRTNSATGSGPNGSGAAGGNGNSQNGSATDSTPLSVLSGSGRYQPGRDPPMVDGKDTRNEATWRRDLLVDYENRKLQGRHEHPFEGSTALHQKSNIKSMGLKQLVRSVSTTIKKSTRKFKNLVLRRAKTIPNQFSAVVHGNVHNIPTPPPAPNPKLVTRNQRLEEYRRITGSVLQTFGPRVPTPPPYQPISRRGSVDLTKPGVQANHPVTSAPNQQASPSVGQTSQSSGANTYQAPNRRQPGLPTGQHLPYPNQNGTHHLPVGQNRNLPDQAVSQAAPRGLDSNHQISEQASGTQNSGANGNGNGPNGFVETAFKGW